MVLRSASLTLLILNEVHLSKKWIFWPNPYNIQIMITSLTEILDIQNFGNLTKFTI